ncbi:serine/threonine-protein kinase [Cellulomonas fimi]|uniref:non-specific serine/threonine protein kinase n=1 Tax=Cellulomonas fimi TaxID=1708 RepID=A0A7Y0LYM4_CELFI|nr:serine/threonine-protein kinase [Cellulomonas fimi]NMR20316.1 serine/threonine protein kinase [Cellulomonas fimi]
MEGSEPAPGVEIGGYRIVAPLGAGGMGSVYRAVDGGGTEVAFKLLHAHLDADPVARDRLRREVAALQRLRHPAVAAVLDAEVDSTEAFLVTELIDGRNLEDHVRVAGPLTGWPLARLASGLRDALEAVHAAGLVHRDLKPSNVLVTPDGPVLIDFGIAQAADDARVTSTGLVAGTPGYLAPELLADGEPGPLSDWWGWAAVLAFAATGRAPFGTRPVDAVLARSQAGDVDVGGLGAVTAGALRAALAPEPDLRALPDDVVADLEAAAERGDEPAPTAVLTTRVAPPVVPPAAASGAPGAGVGSTRVRPSWAGSGTPAGDEDPHADAGLDAADGAAGAGPYDEPPAYVSPRPRRRTGTVLALAVLATAGASLYPGLTLLVLAAALVLARTVGSAAGAMQARREARGGAARSDVARAVVSSPWHLVRAVVGLLPSLLVGGSVVVLVGGLLWWLLGTGQVVVDPASSGRGAGPDGSNAPWVYPGVLALAMLLGLAVVWFGPMATLTRVGARRTLAAVAPGLAGAGVVVVLALAGAVLLAALVASGHPITWTPLPGPPSFA